MILLVPIFIFTQDGLFNSKSLVLLATNESINVASDTKPETIELSADLSSSDIQFTYNTYSSIHSNDYEKSFALENMEVTSNISSYTTPTFLLDESNLRENSTNFSF
jgi:hypothetical protein